MSDFTLYSQIPSTLSMKHKISYIKKIFDLGIQGVSLSTLPSNHDIFQLLAVISKEYPFKFGISIISPLFYRFENLEKSIITITELLGTEKRVFFGFGLGDRYALKKYYPNERNFFHRFKTTILGLKNNLTDKGLNLDFLIAGSGKKMTNFALENELGVLFNGVDISPTLYDSNGLSVFIMSHFGNLETISDSHLRILIKMLISLPKNERERLEIGNQIIIDLKNSLKNNKTIEQIKTAINPELIRKISFLGSSYEFKELLGSYHNYNVQKVVVSQSPFEDWTSFVK
jgi:hypothetical protein